MKKLLFSLLYCFGFHFAVLGQSGTEQLVQPTLTHATVFQNRAELTSTVRVTVQPTTQLLIVEDIPLGIDPGSIQVKGTGDAVITGVRFDRNYLKNAPRPTAILKLDDSLRNVQNELAELELAASVLQEEKALILANKQMNTANVGLKVTELKDMANFYRDRLTEIGSKLMKIKARQEEVKAREGRLKNQLADWQNRRQQPSGVIQLALAVSGRTTLSLELSYVVMGAGWIPFYDLRVKDTKSPVTMAYKARVYQNTGQNWENIKLSLSTANPSQNGAKPELTTQYVSFKEPVARQMRAPAMMSKSLAVEPMVAGAPPALEADIQTSADYTQISSNDLVVTFDIALPYSIVSGGEAQLVDISQYEVPATYRLFAVPKLDPDAFLVAELSGWEKYNLLNGSANVYFQGTYLGETQLITQNVRDTLVVSLGRDKRVIVKKERLNEYSSQRMLGNTIRETVSYRITVRNTRAESIQLLVEDQVPVSQNSDIELTIQEDSNARYTAENGMLRWESTLKPSETRTFDVRFELKYPKGKTLIY